MAIDGLSIGTDQSPVGNRQSVYSSTCSLQSSIFKLHHSNPSAPLVVLRRTEVRDERVRAEELRDRAPQRAGAVAVDDAQVPQLGGHRVVQEPLDAAHRFF